MEKNVGGLDRFFRLGIGFLSLAMTVALQGALMQVIFGLVAVFGLVTAVTGYCPMNRRFGVNTRQKKDH